MHALQETLAILDEMKQQHDTVLVSYSGGKDSVVCLDLAVKTFKRVEAFFMYFVPEMECVLPAMEYAKQRWGITVRQYPHFAVLDDMRRGVYCNNTDKISELPQYNLQDIYNVARADTGIKPVITGAKRNDSMMRRQRMKWQKMGTGDVWHPLAGWTNHDVRAYVLSHKLQAPMSNSVGGRQSSGLDLTEDSLLWLHDNYPKDFAKVSQVFVYAPAVVYKRKFYGKAK
jgi:phosphoadenosine phosphosulfate reductase